MASGFIHHFSLQRWQHLSNQIKRVHLTADSAVSKYRLASFANRDVDVDEEKRFAFGIGRSAE
jgi:hypothetical protein